MNDETQPQPVLSHKEVSRRGGNAFKEQYGSEGFAAMARKKAEITKQKDPDFYKRLSKAGIEARAKKKAAKNNPVNKFVRILTGKSTSPDTK